ncbi:MAG TPA: hypothetical protein VGC72_11460 [Candidatus Elarobacter sp.]
MIFRTRNLGTSASPPGTVTFQLGDGLEALGDADVAVASVAPGEDVVAVMNARVAAPLDDRTEIAVQGVLSVRDVVLRTNVCTVLARSRPVLDGAASGTFVELLDADRVRVRAVVTNEGDGAARDVRIDVPAPAGCLRVNDDEPASLELERLDAGASFAVAFEARIVEPVAVLQADDAEVRFGEGLRCALPVREVVMMEPVIAAPAMDVHPARRSAEFAIDVRNDGWVDARDVRVRIALPAAVRMVDGSIVADGVPVAVLRGRRRSAARRGRGRVGDGGDAVFARVERSGDAHVVVVPVPARRTVRIAGTATFPGGFAGGTIVAGVGSHDVAMPFVPKIARDVRMRLLETPRTVVPGGEVRVVAEVVNAGDVAEELFFCTAGDGFVAAREALLRIVGPGTVAAIELTARAPENAPGHEPLCLDVVVCDTERERARAQFSVIVRDRREACCDDAASDAERMPAIVHSALHAPDEVSTGVPFAIRVDIDVEDAVETLVVRTPVVAGAAYVPGSTSLDGRRLVDRAGGSPLAGDGLALRSVPAGSRVTAGWTLIADPAVCDEALIVNAAFNVDREDRVCEPVAVTVRGRDAFAAQSAGFGYHVDALVIEKDPPPAEPAPEEAETPASDPRPAATPLFLPTPPFVALTPSHAVTAGEPVEGPPLRRASGSDAFSFRLRVDSDRLDDVTRLLNGTTGNGLVPDLFALRAFFPDDESSDDSVVASALDRVRRALHDVLDRLFVKLRIPGFAIAADDVDDVELRHAMTELFERLLVASSGAERCDGATVRITRERIGELLAGIAGTPYGAPAALRALVAFVPTRCETDPALSAALARYSCALDDVLARYEGVPLELFDDALARASDRALDDARLALATTLHARAAFTEVAC